MPADITFRLSSLEEFQPANYLRVAAIFYFDPRGVAVFGHICALPVLGDDAFEIARTRECKEVFAVALDIVDAEDMQWVQQGSGITGSEASILRLKYAIPIAAASKMLMR